MCIRDSISIRPPHAYLPYWALYPYNVYTLTLWFPDTRFCIRFSWGQHARYAIDWSCRNIGTTTWTVLLFYKNASFTIRKNYSHPLSEGLFGGIINITLVVRFNIYKLFPEPSVIAYCIDFYSDSCSCTLWALSLIHIFVSCFINFSTVYANTVVILF